MTIVASGPLKTAALRTEYGGGIPMRLGTYARGHTSLRVRRNAANNVAVNHSAGVPLTGQPLRLGNFRGQGKGWTYTNTTARIAVAEHSHYHCHVEFGSDWNGANGTDWPMFYINNEAIVSSSTLTYALVIYGRMDIGPFTFTNNHEIQAGGGATTGAGGQHAVYIYNTVAGANRPIFVNNYAVRGGGGAGGQGGVGGQGGAGTYTITVYDPASGYYYTNNGAKEFIESGDRMWKRHDGASDYFAYGWLGTLSTQIRTPAGTTSHVQGIYTYERGAQKTSYQNPDNYENDYLYEIRRHSQQAQATTGGAGGAGGAGGRGIGWNAANQGGVLGVAGVAGGTNAGAGGQGGQGGTGGSWGLAGASGATGNIGGAGNAGSGLGGGAGGAGGAGGYSIYAASPWGLINNNTLNGLYGSGAAPT